MFNPGAKILKGTGKSLSEALLYAEHGENIFCTKIVLNVKNNFCTQHVLPNFELGIFMYSTCNAMNNLLSYCGLVDSKIRASDKDLPVLRCTKPSSKRHLFSNLCFIRKTEVLRFRIKIVQNVFVFLFFKHFYD